MMTRALTVGALILVASACASQPAEKKQLDVSARRIDASDSRRPTMDHVYEVTVGNDSGETIFLSAVALESWQEPGLLRDASTHPNITMEAGEYRDFTIFAEVDTRGATTDAQPFMVGAGPGQIRVVITYRIGTREVIESHDVVVARRRSR